VTAARLAALRALGFNRLSFGIQDTDPDVQHAVHRIQPFEQVQELVEAARNVGFASINVDLIYGLPKQTEASFAATLARIGELRPDRIALYAYAHLPARFKPQRRIEAAALPAASVRVALLGNAIRTLLAQGYLHIGMDHFALPDDPLAIAKQGGKLQRNFQGYSTGADLDLIGLGVSAIGRLGPLYYQNAKSLPAYYDALVAGRLPVVRGHVLDADDERRRDAIMALMCTGRLDRERLSAFRAEAPALHRFAERGLVELAEDGLTVTPAGWFAIRAIAMTFDRYLRADPAPERFSRVV
jgi:oxygen-independent coproporphyrinogen-3 oxidase